MKTADGDYNFGPPSVAGEPQMWGIRVVTSPVIAIGTALVGDFATGARIWDREEVRVTFTESGALGAAGAEIFSRNQILFRGEERLALGVERPAAFCTVTGL